MDMEPTFHQDTTSLWNISSEYQNQKKKEGFSLDFFKPDGWWQLV